MAIRQTRKRHLGGRAQLFRSMDLLPREAIIPNEALGKRLRRSREMEPTVLQILVTSKASTFIEYLTMAPDSLCFVQ